MKPDKIEILNGINEALKLGEVIVQNKTFNIIYEYEQLVKKLVKRLYSDYDSKELKMLLIRLLELKKEYSNLYKFIVVSKTQFDYYLNWENEGKYLYYIERSSHMLKSIIRILEEKY